MGVRRASASARARSSAASAEPGRFRSLPSNPALSSCTNHPARISLSHGPSYPCFRLERADALRNLDDAGVTERVDPLGWIVEEATEDGAGMLAHAVGGRPARAEAGGGSR